ncbi:MAG: TonB-dependent receptor plug domain-containing protein, partial [Deltaproteobacteria bacterium]|nr:TonB-dependent receptor plug domain-containing protein [Deltaproteobacteria bacterium]
AITLLKRQNRAEVSDAISAEEMSKTPDSNAAAAVKRVVSATVVGGRYLFVRGLGGRYVSTLLNGVPLPSPEPDKQAVPLDIFPTRLLSNLTILKSYDSSLPGRFGGGTMAIETPPSPRTFSSSCRPRARPTLRLPSATARPTAAAISTSSASTTAPGPCPTESRATARSWSARA